MCLLGSSSFGNRFDSFDALRANFQTGSSDFLGLQVDMLPFESLNIRV